MSQDDYKVCPYCSEQIKLKAIKCRYCQTSLNENDSDGRANISGGHNKTGQIRDNESSSNNINHETKNNKNEGVPLILGIVGIVVSILPLITLIISSIGLALGLRGLKRSVKPKMTKIGIALCSVGIILNLSIYIFGCSAMLQLLTTEDEIIAERHGSSEQAITNNVEKTTPSYEELQVDELATVESAELVIQSQEHKSLYPDMIQVITKNNHSETVKDLKIGLLAYDANGYPVKIMFHLGFIEGDDYNKGFIAEDANIPPGEVYGHDKGVKLDRNHNIHYVLACIYEATFYNNEVWTNPNYDIWLNEFKEKPLPRKYRN